MAETKVNQNQLNIGNESALDLLIERNTAKSDLATNLQGKGINADASTETLNELVNKVPDILSSSEEELVPAITISVSTASNPRDESTPGINFHSMNGYLFFVRKDNSNLYYIKLSTLKDIIAADNTSVNLSGNEQIKVVAATTGFQTQNNAFSNNSNFTKLFVSYGSTTSGIACFDIVWDGDDITSVTFNSNITISNSTEVYALSSNSDGNKILYVKNGTNAVFLYNFSDNTHTQINNTSSGLSTSPYMGVYFLEDDEFLTVTKRDGYWMVTQYHLEGTVATSYGTAVNTESINGTESSNQFGVNTKLIKYDVGKYKLFMEGQINNTNSNALKLTIYDTNTRTISNYRNCKNIGTTNTNISNNSNARANPIDLTQRDGYNIVTYCTNFFIFDANWNNINNISFNNIGTNNISCAYFIDNHLVCISRSLYGYRYRYWLGKKTIIKRTVSINGETKNFWYTPFNAPTADIDAGYFD